MRGVTTKLAGQTLALALASSLALASNATPRAPADAPGDRPARRVIQSGETFATDTTITADEVVLPPRARISVEGGAVLRIEIRHGCARSSTP